MNAIEKRALYNLLRMNWLNDPTLAVEAWQVEDCRHVPLPDLFGRLLPFDIHLDRVSFVAYADECDSPEELTEHLIADREYSATEEDRIYLTLFELWRRLMSEKPSLSIVCNELDYQIHLYDEGLLDNPFSLQDAWVHFLQILDENADQGIQPEQVLELISKYCANDIETFLYDFILEQIEAENEPYALELLNDFDVYLGNSKWFKLLKFRISLLTQNKAHQKIAEEIVEDELENPLDEGDLDYHLEFLSALAEGVSEKGIGAAFCLVAEKILPLINREEDFQDFLAIAINYFRRPDQKQQEMALQEILRKRTSFPSNQTLNKHDPDLDSIARLLRL